MKKTLSTAAVALAVLGGGLAAAPTANAHVNPGKVSATHYHHDLRFVPPYKNRIMVQTRIQQTCPAKARYKADCSERIDKRLLLPSGPTRWRFVTWVA